MIKLYPKLLAFLFLLSSMTVFAVEASATLSSRPGITADTTKNKGPKITDTRPNKPSIPGVKINIVPFKPGPAKVFTNANGTKTVVQDDKILNNVKVYPNPVNDELNVSYRVTKESNVTIKIMDILGNEIATLLSTRLPAGDIKNTFDVSSKLNTGFYFIRVVVGNESIIKRISVL